MVKALRVGALALACATAFSLTAAAQDSAELLERMKAMEARIKALEAEVQSLKSQQTAALTAPGTPAGGAAIVPAVARTTKSAPGATASLGRATAPGMAASRSEAATGPTAASTTAAILSETATGTTAVSTTAASRSEAATGATAASPGGASAGIAAASRSEAATGATAASTGGTAAGSTVASAGGAAPAAAAQAQQTSTSLGGAGGAAAKALNPDIAVIGDFLGAAGNSAGRRTPALEMHESEAAFQAILDPYARADFFLSFGEHGVDLEEGYLTFPALKGGVQLRVGKMRAAFGKVNTLHNHVLPWTDRPLVTNNLVGGEDGIDDAGLALSRIFAGPKEIFLEGTAQIFRGDSENLFHSYNRSDVSTVEHLRGYRDLSESTNLDVGVSYSRGHSVLGPEAINQLYGVDATVRWKPLRRAIYHSFLGRSEFIWSRIDQPRLATMTPFGYYISGDYQFARRWFIGSRFDRSDRLATPIVLQRDTGGSLVLTYWPSEFSQIRGQLRRTNYGDNRIANEFLFQFQFSIGAHGAHPF